MKLNAKRLALIGGIFWGASLMIMAWITMKTGYGKEFLDIITSFYPGYSLSLVGSFIGLGLGFVDAFVCLYVFASIYNWLIDKLSQKQKP